MSLKVIFNILDMNEIFNKYLTKNKLILCLILLGLILYLDSFFNEFLWDDLNIIQNVYLKNWHYISKYFTQNLVSGANEASNYWRPLLLISFSFDWHISKFQPIFYHIHNLFLHVASAILLFLTLELLFGKKYFSFLISLIFLIHPLQTEAVTYISGRGDSLSVLFIFLAIFFFIKTFYNKKEILIKKWYFLSLFCFILSLLSKETAMVTPFLIILIMFSFPRKFFAKNIINLETKEKVKEMTFRTAKRLIPFFVVLAIFLSLRLTVLNFQNILNFGNYQDIYAMHTIVRIFTFFRVLLTYLGLIFLPANLHMERVASIETAFFTFPVFLGFLIFLAMIILAIYDFLNFFSFLGRGLAAKKSLAQAERAGCPSEARTSEAERERSDLAGGGHSVFSCGKPKSPYFFFGIGWFFITLAPYSNIAILINGMIYEHWMYLPIIGISICVVNFAQDILGGKKKFIKNLAILFLIFYFTFLGIKTILRNREWRDPIVFYNQALKYSKSSRLYVNLGIAYFDIGEYEKAKENYLKAIDFSPMGIPQAYNNLGNVFAKQGKYDEAIFYYNKALKIQKNWPLAIVNLGTAYLKKGDLTKAKEFFLLYNQLLAEDFYPYVKLGEINLYEKNCALSLEYFKKAQKLASNDKGIQQEILHLIELAKECRNSQ